MELLIGQNYKITRMNENNLALWKFVKTHVKKNRFVKEEYDKEDWEHVGYYGCLSHALERVLTFDIYDCDAKSLKEVLDKIQSSTEEIKLALKNSGLSMESFPKPPRGKGDDEEIDNLESD